MVESVNIGTKIFDPDKTYCGGCFKEINDIVKRCPHCRKELELPEDISEKQLIKLVKKNRPVTLRLKEGPITNRKSKVTPGFRQMERQVAATYKLADTWITGNDKTGKLCGEMLKRVLDMAKIYNCTSPDILITKKPSNG